MILITGSSGFIGSRVTRKLLENGYKVIGIDLRPAIKDLLEFPQYHHREIDITDQKAVASLFDEVDSETIVFHLAALIKVDESEIYPNLYYKHNFLSTLNILSNIISNHPRPQIIFASTAAVYGNKFDQAFREDDAGNPKSVYGRTKLMCEQLICDYVKAYNINAVIFRFFNVAGGQHTDPPCHLISTVIDKLMKKEPIEIFGTDYSTSDGTCVRDYIHVDDIADAFLKAIVLIKQNKGTRIFNLGSSCGYSVREIINQCIKIFSKRYPNLPISSIVETEKRIGDPPIVYADIQLATKELKWKPQKDIHQIIEDSFE